MATRTEVTEWIVCDLHETEHEGTETIEFSMEGTAYSIDLCEAGAERMRRAVAPFTEAAQVQTGRKRTRTRTSSNGKTAAHNPSENDQIRTWARGNGFDVADRGRISGEIIVAYKEAHKRSRQPAAA